MIPFGTILASSANFDNPIMLPSISGMSILIVLGSLLLVLFDEVNQTAFAHGFSSILSIDTMTFTFKNLFFSICLLTVIAGRNFLQKSKAYGFELDQLLITSILGLSLLIISNDLLMIYLAIELQSLCFYSIVAINYYSELSVEASLKYFLLGALASCFLLFGFSLIYFTFGATLFDTLFVLVYSTASFNHATFGLVLILITILIKLGAAPFHI